jgi:hypothetical protein
MSIAQRIDTPLTGQVHSKGKFVLGLAHCGSNGGTARSVGILNRDQQRSLV